MKAIPCRLRLHEYCTEIDGWIFPSVSAAKKWISVCWNKPYTIVKLKGGAK